MILQSITDVKKGAIPFSAFKGKFNSFFYTKTKGVNDR